MNEHLHLQPARVLQSSQISPGTYVLRIERHSDFVPGQNVSLTVGPEVPARDYSIISGPRESYTEILYDLVPGGVLTPRLAGLREGARVYVSQPFGSFRDGAGPAWWVAGGTGIAPFLSMIRSGLGSGKLLVQGSRSLQGLHFREYLAAALGDAYHPCCSRPERACPGVYAGRLIEQLPALRPPADQRYLLCGSAEMVVAVRDLLIGAGVPFTSITAEIFF